MPYLDTKSIKHTMSTIMLVLIIGSTLIGVGVTMWFYNHIVDLVVTDNSKNYDRVK